MMKRHYEGPRDPIGQIHRVGDQNNYRNFPLSDSPKTIDLIEESPEEDSLEGDFLEEEDSLEEEDIPEEEEYCQEDHLEEGGDCRRYPCHKPIKESW